MRGLTDKERGVLVAGLGEKVDDDTLENLLTRGLMRSLGWFCDSCVTPSEQCDCGCEYEQEEYEPTVAGRLALRLDAAARSA